MSLRPCLPGLVEQGKLTKEQADRAGALFDELQQDLRRQFGDQTAAAMATDATLRAMEKDLLRRKFVAGKTIAARQRIELELGQFNGGKSGGAGNGGGGPIDPRAGPAFFDRDDRAPYSNVDGRRRAIKGRAHGMMDRVLAEHSANLVGEVRNKAQLVDIVRELFGENSGNGHAHELADAWSQTAEMLRQRYNAAGGNIGKLDRWGLPQSHDSRAVRKAGYDAWRAEILPRLDRARMLDERTGLPFSDEGLELALRDVFETIRTDGWNKRNAGGQGVASLANRRGEARFLQFRSAADWLAYSERFGGGTAFDAMMGHIDGMARDIALMEVLGPNPNATVEWLKDTLVKSAELDTRPDSKAIERAEAAAKQIDGLFDEITGAANRPESRALALGFSVYRSYKTATALGSAFLSAVTDTAFQFSTRKFNGLGAASMIRDYAKLFRPGSIEDQKLAVRLGLIAEEWSNKTSAQSRMLGEELTGETSRRLAEGVLRVSGLSRWTQAGRWAFGMEFLGAITDHRGKTFAQLDPAFRAMFERNGFTAADWDAVRATPVEIERGVEWIKPSNVANQALGDRLLEVILAETDMAVPVADLRTKAMINSVTPSGTPQGEAVKSMFLFKSFGISVLLMHGKRALAMTSPAQRARYVGGLVIGTTLMGALAIQLKDLAAGRDPREMDNPEFWGAAMLQGGGFGIFGDLLKSAENRLGGGIAGSLAGPFWSDVQDIANIATSSNPRGALFKELKSQLPGNNIWYTRLAFDRMVADQLQEMIDPGYRKSWRNMHKWAGEQGTQFYWAPGDALPDRAPDLTNITAEGSEVQ